MGVDGVDSEQNENNSNLSVYGFIGNDGLNSFDYAGLWRIKRDRQAKATAVAESGDTVLRLASLIGLRPGDYREWLSADSGTAMPSSWDQTMNGCEQFQIPNTVVAYWAGAGLSRGRPFAQDYVQWNRSVSYLGALGFYLDTHNHVVGDKWALRYILDRRSKSKELHGLYFWGEGFRDPNTMLYWGLGSRTKPRDPLIPWNDTGLEYGMALGLVFACGSNSGEQALMSMSDGQIWHGFTGILYPHPFHFFEAYHFIHHGDQGTK